MWRFETEIKSVGTICIEFIPSEGGYGTTINGTVWEVCDTPQASADNVYMHCTGCYEWDSLFSRQLEVPHDLSEWKKC